MLDNYYVGIVSYSAGPYVSTLISGPIASFILAQAGALSFATTQNTTAAAIKWDPTVNNTITLVSDQVVTTPVPPLDIWVLLIYDPSGPSIGTDAWTSFSNLQGAVNSLPPGINWAVLKVDKNFGTWTAIIVNKTTGSVPYPVLKSLSVLNSIS